MIKKTFISSALACALAIAASSALATNHKDSTKDTSKHPATSAQQSGAKKSTDGLRIYSPSDFETNELYESNSSKMIKSVSLVPNEKNDKVMVKVSGAPGAKAKVGVQPQNITIELKEVSAGNFEATIDNVTREMIFNSTFHVELSSGKDVARTVNSMILHEKDKKH